MSFISSSFIVKVVVIFTAAVFLSLPSFSQDTTIKFSVPYRFVVQGTRSGSITIPLPHAKKDTIYIHDTTYIYKCPEVSKEIRFSEFGGTFQQFVDSASRSKSKAVVDRVVDLKETVKLSGVNIIGRGGYITSTAYTVFELLPAKQTIDSLPIFASASTWYTFLRKPTTNALYSDSISNCAIIGGRFGYMSSQGGNKDSLCVTAMHNTSLHTSFIGIMVYSQDGPYRALHLSNAYIKSDSGHNIYAHPNISIRFDSVVTENFPYKIADGTYHSANALQYFSGNNGEVMEGTQKYFELRRCRSVRVNGYTGMWIVLGPKNTPAIIENSEIAPYNVWQRVHVRNSKLINAGQGVIINGIVDNCTGEVWSGGKETIVNGGTFNYVSARVGGTITFNDVIASYMDVADRGNNFAAFVNSSAIRFINDGGKGNGTITFYNSPIPQNNCRAGMIKQVEVK